MGREIERAEFGTENCGAPQEELPLLSLNHVSFSCRSVKESMRFYQDVLGFILIKRPSSFDFEGAWLFNHGIGIHLIESDNLPPKKDLINPKDCHISFQCSNMDALMQRLEKMNIEHVTAMVKEGGITVEQVFFHDPDGYMIEICNCQNIPILPVSSSCPVRLPKTIEFAPNRSLSVDRFQILSRWEEEDKTVRGGPKTEEELNETRLFIGYNWEN